MGKRAVHDIIEIGRRLIDAKERCKAEGRWLRWIKDEFDWSRQTADNFIAVGQASLKVPNFGSLDVPVSGLYLLAAPSTPAEVIDAVAERSAEGGRLSLDEVKRMVAEAEAKTEERMAKVANFASLDVPATAAT